MSDEPLLWVGFNGFVLGMLALDLYLFHRKPHEVMFKEALGWTFVWVFVSLLFNLGIFVFQGPEAGLQFLTGYVIEKSLSVDNLFVFISIFSLFGIPYKYQHKVLFWGILGAIVMRALFILVGVELIQRFHWIIYGFGGFLVYTGIRMVFHKESIPDLEKNLVMRLVRRFFPITHEMQEEKFFIVRNGKRYGTPLFVALVMIEASDLLFAVDSIPAVLAITPDPFIVYTSNILAILGLRSLYFALAGATKIFQYLHYGLAFILVFVGVKMLIKELYDIPIGVAMGLIVAVLAGSVLASVLANRRESRA